MRSRSSKKTDRDRQEPTLLRQRIRFEIALRGRTMRGHLVMIANGWSVQPPSVLFGLIAPAFVMARHRTRRRREERVKALLDDGVAFARCLLETSPIEDLDRSSTVAYETRRLH